MYAVYRFLNLKELKFSKEKIILSMAFKIKVIQKPFSY